jgi:hypothetical protein
MRTNYHVFLEDTNVKPTGEKAMTDNTLLEYQLEIDNLRQQLERAQTLINNLQNANNRLEDYNRILVNLQKETLDKFSQYFYS